jgi:hypothetical protein
VFEWSSTANRKQSEVVLGKFSLVAFEN